MFSQYAKTSTGGKKKRKKKRKTESIGESYVSRQDRTRTRSRAHAHHKLGLMRFYANTRANDNDLNSHERTEVEDILLTTHTYIYKYTHTYTHSHTHTYTHFSTYTLVVNDT